MLQSPRSDDSVELTKVFRRMSQCQITVPINPFKVITDNRWQLSTYMIFSKVLRMDFYDMKNYFSDGAFSFYSHSGNTYYIIYNNEMPHGKICYALAHEIGHIVCNHISKHQPYGQSFGHSENAQMEALADEFARYVLNLEGKSEI